MEINKIYNENCLTIMGIMPDNFIDLIITSPPYNCGIEYDSWDDNLSFDDYYSWVEKWLSECFRVLKPDGRIAINIPLEVSIPFRYPIFSEFWNRMQKIGFKWAGLVRLEETVPHRVKYSAWGSWLSASSPYIYNTEECVILGYKNVWKKENKGESTINKETFIQNVKGVWKYEAEKKVLTKANFSLDLPLNAIQSLSYKNDLIYDPFMGSGTTAVACIKTERQFIGSEISSSYYNIANRRIAEALYAL